MHWKTKPGLVYRSFAPAKLVTVQQDSQTAKVATERSNTQKAFAGLNLRAGSTLNGVHFLRTRTIATIRTTSNS
jgi:hypothetical protein